MILNTVQLLYIRRIAYLKQQPPDGYGFYSRELIQEGAARVLDHMLYELYFGEVTDVGNIMRQFPASTVIRIVNNSTSMQEFNDTFREMHVATNKYPGVVIVKNILVRNLQREP